MAVINLVIETCDVSPLIRRSFRWCALLTRLVEAIIENQGDMKDLGEDVKKRLEVTNGALLEAMTTKTRVAAEEYAMCVRLHYIPSPVYI